MMGLSRGMVVEGLEVYNTSRFAVGLADYDHPMAPGVGGADGDFLQHAKADISIEVCLDLLPVNGHCGCLVSCNRCRRRVDVEA